ncbi:MAG: GNAT family N-acetyltransferase [Abitibacteriaceae bacterium]|nr:GNAT family N-acetyltransferase [Abditibacteriaceae bacterium]
MVVAIREASVAALPQYESVPIAFRVTSRFAVTAIDGGLGGFQLTEEPVTPYIKDYDADASQRPPRWPHRWDMTHWGIFTAHLDAQLVGGAAVAWRTPELCLLDGREAVACLWDLRVHPDYRSRAIGHQLFARALDWSRERGCRIFQVETQNINVPACRFYARQGCELAAINRYAYDAALNEVQLIWYRDI